MKEYLYSKIKKIQDIGSALICLVFFTLSSCKKFIQIAPPVTQLVSTSVFANDQSANAAQLAVYAQMAGGNSFNISWYGGLAADELTNYSNDISLIQLYSNGLIPANQSITGIWSEAYMYIYEENAIIENLQNAAGVSEPVKKQLVGEAKFIRAFWHFYLVNFFGDIPYVNSTNYLYNATLSRSPVIDVYKQIVDDLKDAQSMLNLNYVDKGATDITTDRTRPSSFTAAALLARVYLFQLDWKNAEIAASLVINNTTQYSLVPSLNNVFLANSKEAIWQLRPVIPNQNTPEGYNFILSFTPGTVSLDSQMLHVFDSGDNRKTSWIEHTNVGGTVYYFPFKYKIRSATSITEYSMVIRLAELYLIRAEARAQQANMQGSLLDLNTIRARAGLNNFFTSDKSSLIVAIIHERQCELFTEWSHRWLDIKRLKIADSIMAHASPLKGGVWNASKQLFPIPQIERDRDSRLTQNPGY